MVEAYRDRRMLKWLAFESLGEHRGYVKRSIEKNHQEPRPILSSDQYETMQYRFEEALALHDTIAITYYSRDQKLTLHGMIEHVFPDEKKLTIAGKSIAIETIVAIE